MGVQSGTYSGGDGTSTDTNTTAGTSTSHNGAGDADLDLESGQTTRDAVVLEADFTTTGNFITVQFTFSSEEYLEYVNGGVNDAFGVWISDTYVPFTPAANDLVSIDTINNVSSSNLYLDNPAAAYTYNTEMDGTTIVLSIKAPVDPAITNSIKIALADGGDTIIGDGGDDTLNGDAGADEIYVSSGNNIIDGGADNDSVFGGTGQDSILDSAGDDSVLGGAGKDTFDYTTLTGDDTTFGGRNQRHDPYRQWRQDRRAWRC